MIASLRTIHEEWSWMVVFSNGLAGLWALAAVRWSTLRTRALWWLTLLAELTLFVQVGLGVALVAGQGYTAPQLHMFYGFLTIITVAILYSYRHQLRARIHLLYGLGGLFLMGLAIRAMVVR